MGDVYVKGHTRKAGSFIRHGLTFGDQETHYFVTQELADLLKQEPALIVEEVPESSVPEHEKAGPGQKATERKLSPGEQAIVAEEARKRLEEKTRESVLNSEAAQKRLEEQSKPGTAQAAPPPPTAPAANDKRVAPQAPNAERQERPVGSPVEASPPPVFTTEDNESERTVISPSHKTKR
jgi:hypothetical protein